MSVILGIDPGYDRCGWAVLVSEGRIFKPLAFDVIQTSKKETKYQRFQHILVFLEAVITTHQVEEIAIEDLFFTRNVNTALPVSEVRGLVFSIAIRSHIPVTEYKPNQIKQTVTGHGQADKQQVTNMVMRQLGLEKIPKIDDTGDALAVALTHAVHRNSRLHL